MIRRIAVLSVLSVVAFAPAAFASPHGEQADGCDHGATSKPCRPDPQPGHGKDCDEHGNHGGINEDHCDSEVTTSTTIATTTTTDSPETTTTTTVGTTPTPGTEEPTSTTEAGPATSANPVSPSGDPTPLRVCDAIGMCPQPPQQTAAELPRTGTGSAVLLILGGWLVLGGLASLAMAQLIRGGK